jgi:hypothetical protein
MVVMMRGGIVYRVADGYNDGCIRPFRALLFFVAIAMHTI